MIGYTAIQTDMISLIPFYFLFDRYDGWILKKGKEKYAFEILELAKEITGEA